MLRISPEKSVHMILQDAKELLSAVESWEAGRGEVSGRLRPRRADGAALAPSHHVASTS